MDQSYLLALGLAILVALGAGARVRNRMLADRMGAADGIGESPFAVSTAAAFEWFDRSHSRKDRVAAARATHDTSASDVFNDLEAVVGARHPEVLIIKRGLIESGASAAAMTGSGSTVFGLFASRAAAGRAADRMRDRGRAIVSRFLTRAEFVRASRPIVPKPYARL